MYYTSSVVVMVTHQQSRITPGQEGSDDVRNTSEYSTRCTKAAYPMWPATREKRALVTLALEVGGYL